MSWYLLSFLFLFFDFQMFSITSLSVHAVCISFLNNLIVTLFSVGFCVSDWHCVIVFILLHTLVNTFLPRDWIFLGFWCIYSDLYLHLFLVFAFSCFPALLLAFITFWATLYGSSIYNFSLLFLCMLCYFRCLLLGLSSCILPCFLCISVLYCNLFISSLSVIHKMWSDIFKQYEPHMFPKAGQLSHLKRWWLPSCDIV